MAVTVSWQCWLTPFVAAHLSKQPNDEWRICPAESRDEEGYDIDTQRWLLIVFPDSDDMYLTPESQGRNRAMT